MEVYIHKETGKGWILIEEINDIKGNFISPASKVMSRYFSDFVDSEDDDPARSLEKGIISSAQIESYAFYKKSRSEEVVDKAWMYYEEDVQRYGKDYATKMWLDALTKKKDEK